MEYIQLLDNQGNQLALFSSNTLPKHDMYSKIEEHIELAKATRQHYLESEYETDIDVLEEAERTLGEIGINRVYVDELSIDIEE